MHGCHAVWLARACWSRVCAVRARRWLGPVRGGCAAARKRRGAVCEYEKGIWWMPWHQEAMKDVARCEKPRGAASRR